MKVLLLTQVLPYPPDSGPKVKTWNVIKHLAPDHDITLVSFIRGDQAHEVAELEKYCQAVYTVPIERKLLLDIWFMGLSFITRQPFLMLRDDRKAMRSLVDKLAAEQPFDVVHADQLNMAQYALRVSGARKVLDAHNALWLLYKRLWESMGRGLKRWLLGRDWKLLKRYEGNMLARFDAVLAVSDEDKVALLDANGGTAPITSIPIAVDTDEVHPIRRRPGADHIVHIGTMYWPPNADGVTWFIKEILPLIRAKRPGLVFDVIGARPPQELIDLAAATPGVNVTGYLEDPTPCLEEAGVMVVPLRAGGGMRVKILNALAQEMPIVTTSIGCEGISVQNGQELLIADTPGDFAEAVLTLLNDQQFAEKLGLQGRQFILTKYDFRVACRPIDQIYRGAVQEDPQS